MIPVPRVRLIILFGIPLIIYIFGFRYAPLFGVAVGCDALILAWAILDALATLPNLNYEVIFKSKKPFSIGRTNSLPVRLVNPARDRSRTRARLAVKLGLPKWIEDQTPDHSMELEGFMEREITFLLRPIRRGSFVIDWLYLRIGSKYGFFYFDQKRRIDLTIDVYPDIKQLSHYLKLSKNNRDYRLGINRNRWIGSGSELESLRDYQKDDDSKLLDWKASTRLNRPISKVFQMETNNQITIALDCGRLMMSEQKGLNTLDHAINSLLILAHIAFNAGDTVSIVAFSDKIIAKTPPLKGRDSLKKITQFLTKLQPGFVESNYAMMFDYLEQTQRKRAFIIVITDMIDDIHYELFKKRINWLSRKHFLLFILMQDTLLSMSANQETGSLDDLYMKAAGREMLLQRNKAILKLKNYHVNVLDVLPHELTGPLINKYLELKARNRL
jgi:uncharacterized protein (DUF58 family)